MLIMAAEFNIDLMGGELLPNGIMRFDPGSTIQARLTVAPDKSVNCKVEVWLEWHTEGRGDRDTQKAQPIQIYNGQISNLNPLYQDFALTLPSEPWSYSGHYINIIWEMHAKLGIPMSSDVNFAKRFILRPAFKPADDLFGKPFIDEKYDPFAGVQDLPGGNVPNPST
jgi:hypothetical protein